VAAYSHYCTFGSYDKVIIIMQLWIWQGIRIALFFQLWSLLFLHIAAITIW